MVNVHADKPVGEFVAHVAGILEGVLDRLGPVVKAVANALGENI